MKIAVSQIYIKPGISFPFSARMQGWLTEELTRLAGDGNKEQEEAYAFVVNISADLQLKDNKIVGPGKFKRYKTIEYTLFLPYEAISTAPDGRRAASAFLMTGIRAILQRAGFDTAKLDSESDRLVNQLATDPQMLKAPWPE